MPFIITKSQGFDHFLADIVSLGVVEVRTFSVESEEIVKRIYYVAYTFGALDPSRCRK